ncbi:hypothetical protein [Mycobacterium riyadhense]|nr:hypothetical protein [Mycobacterium riyadhense]
MSAINLNADVRFGVWRLGDDEAITAESVCVPGDSPIKAFR